MRNGPLTVVLSVLTCVPALAQWHGKVTMPDGSAPPQKVFIERICSSTPPILDAVTNKKGEYFWRGVPPEPPVRVGRGILPQFCRLHARTKELESNFINITNPRVLNNMELPKMVLQPRGAAPADLADMPRDAVEAWQAAAKAFKAQRWAEAEKLGREVVRQAPKYAAAWTLVALACASQNKMAEARTAFQRSVEADPTALPTRLQLVRVEIGLKLWLDAAKDADALIQADTTRKHPDAFLHRGVARFMVRDVEGARADWLKFLELAPASPNAGPVKLQLEALGRRPAQTAAPAAAAEAPSIAQAMLAPEPEPEREQEFRLMGEAWAPGGRKALASIAGLSETPDQDNFFVEYCRAIARQTARSTARPTPGYIATLQAYLTSVAELMDLGERTEERTVLTLSLNEARTPRILALLGWQVTRDNGAARVEPGDQAADGPRQRIPRALGIDEGAMQRELEAGREFRFEIPLENAALAGGKLWGPLVQGFTTLPGGIAEAFARDARIARVYAGLAAVQSEIATALVKRVPLRSLAATHADALWLYGDTFRGGIPGGRDAAPVWQRLAGVSPQDPARFYDALLKLDRGRLAAFYAALARGGPERQFFVLQSFERAHRLYTWYRGTEDLREGVGVTAPGWPTRLLENLPVDNIGRLRFPGGPAAWSKGSPKSDDEILWPPTTSGNLKLVNAPSPVDLEALGEIVELESRRGAPLDTESARLLARHFREWRPLFGYFASMPRLGAAEFRALEEFASAVSEKAPAEQESAMAAWHSAAALIVLGRKAGSLDDEGAARAFGNLCRTGDALAVVREIAGEGNIDDAVATRLLRLTAAKRASFDRVRDMQGAPRLTGAASRTTSAALVGAVYGAVFDPDTLLLAEVRDLLRRHRFVPHPQSLFAPAALSGSRLTGGFVGLEEIARRLSRAGAEPPNPLEELAGGSGAAASSEIPADTIFRASGRLVEVNATVTDERGRHVDGLRGSQFTILDHGSRVSLSAFENGAAALSCVLLLDTSQSMEMVIPALKSAARRLIAGLRPDDAVAVYSLTGGISELQAFTTDKAAAAAAVTRAEIGEMTALYDGLVRVNRDLAARTGKKVIVVFTDGEDNASALTASTAIQRAKAAGVPIYAIALGNAIRHGSLLQELSGMSDATGGLSFPVRTSAEIGPVFANVLQDLLHGYLLAFSPAPGEGRDWRRIEVRAPGKVRARQGYYPE